MRGSELQFFCSPGPLGVPSAQAEEATGEQQSPSNGARCAPAFMVGAWLSADQNSEPTWGVVGVRSTPLSSR